MPVTAASLPAQVADFSVARWPGGFGAAARCPVFSCPVLSCRYSPLQPTPTGAIEKVRFAIQVCRYEKCRGCTVSPGAPLSHEKVFTLRSGARGADSRPIGASRMDGGRVGWRGVNMARRGVNGPGAGWGSFRARCVLTSGIGWVKGPQVARFARVARSRAA
jgi:hypothetical protein